MMILVQDYQLTPVLIIKFKPTTHLNQKENQLNHRSYNPKLYMFLIARIPLPNSNIKILYLPKTLVMSNPHV